MTLALLIGAWLISETISAAENETRLQIRVKSDSPEMLPCRLHVFDVDRNRSVRTQNLPFWHDHFVCNGEIDLKVEPGNYRIEIERGPEWTRGGWGVLVEAGRTEKYTQELLRIADMPSEGWHCGDLHVHRPVEQIPLLMNAEDLHISPVITWWNQKNLWTKEMPPTTLTQQLDDNRIYNVMAGEDEREGGALLFFGLNQPLPITKATREYPSPVKFIEMARQQNPRTWIDIEKPFWWDVPVWLALGKVDSIGIANNHMCRSSMYETEAWGKPRDALRLPPPCGNGYWSQEIYYHVLNAGLHIPPSAGSASGVLPNPVGYNRVYVYTGTETLRDAEQLWWDGLKAGRSFVTNGPLLRVRAYGHPPGHTFRAPAGSMLSIPLKIRLTTLDDVEEIEMIQNGKVVDRIPVTKNPDYSTEWTLNVKESGWFLLRAIAKNQRTFRFASTAPFYVEFGEMKECISRKSAQFFLDWVNERAERVPAKLEEPDQLREVLDYHNRAREFWQKRVAAANAE